MHVNLHLHAYRDDHIHVVFNAFLLSITSIFVTSFSGQPKLSADNFEKLFDRCINFAWTRSILCTWSDIYWWIHLMIFLCVCTIKNVNERCNRVSKNAESASKTYVLTMFQDIWISKRLHKHPQWFQYKQKLALSNVNFSFSKINNIKMYFNTSSSRNSLLSTLVLNSRLDHGHPQGWFVWLELGLSCGSYSISNSI